MDGQSASLLAQCTTVTNKWRSSVLTQTIKFPSLPTTSHEAKILLLSLQGRW